MDSNLACSNKIHRLDDGTISLDMALVMLSRLQEPFRDADVAAYDGYEACDASGLNAAITVLRQTYRAVLLLLQESVDGYLHDKVGKATAEIFLTLKKNEEAFPLLDCAWRNIPLLDFTAGPEMKEGVKKEHKDILDKFFGAWNGLKGDLCFSAILAGNEAAKYVWDLARFHFYSPFKWTKHSSGLWVLMKPTGPTELLSKLSLIEWFAHDKSTLPEHLQGLFAPRQGEGQEPHRDMPRYPWVLRVRYIPGETDGYGLNDLVTVDLPGVAVEETEQTSDDGRMLYKMVEPAPLSFAYKLFAVVRLRNKPDEPDFVRAFDPRTPERIGRRPPETAASRSWRVGAAGHKYDLFYCSVNPSHVRPESPEDEARASDIRQWEEEFAQVLAKTNILAGPEHDPAPILEEHPVSLAEPGRGETEAETPVGEEDQGRRAGLPSPLSQATSGPPFRSTGRYVRHSDGTKEITDSVL